MYKDDEGNELLRDSSRLQRIEDYNRDDVEATREVHRWLLKMRSQSFEHEYKDASYLRPEENNGRMRKRIIEVQNELVKSVVADRVSGIPNDDESLELVERMLLLFHLPEFFQKEETKKYSDALRFLEEADPNQPDCLALLETQPQLVSEPVRGGFRHLLYFPPNSFPSQNWEEVGLKRVIESQLLWATRFPVMF